MEAETPPEKSAPVTVEQLDLLCKSIADQKARIQEVEDHLKNENKILAKLEATAASHLEELDRTSFKSDYGTIYVQQKWSWSLPATPEAKEAFFSHLKEKGLFDQYATVHHAAYNAYLKAEFEAAKEDGRGMEFSIPGVPEPTLFRKLSHRKN